MNLFILITGYFMCESSFKVLKIVKLEMAVLFYSQCHGMMEI